MALTNYRAVTGALTSCPAIFRELEIEPQGPSNAPVAMAMDNNFSSGFASATYSLAGLGGLLGQRIPRPPPSFIPGMGGFATNLFPASAFLDLKKVIELGVNTPQFYSVIGLALPAAQPIQQISQQASEVNKDHPSLWYVNFPKTLSVHDTDMVRRYRQSVLDFRSWSSAKWWQEVNRRFGNPSDPTQRMQQSREFAKIACADMVKMSWLRTTKSPVDNMHRIVCDAAELHNRIVSQVLHGWTDVDGETMDALEPLLQDIVRSTQRGGGDFSEMKVVITERYIYNENTHAITSYIRLFCFELKEAFYDVIAGKAEREARVDLQLSLLQYEAIFEASLWDQYSDSLQPVENDVFKDIITRQTIDLRPKSVK